MLKSQSHPQILVRIDHLSGSFKTFRLGKKLDNYNAVYMQRVEYVHVTAVQAKLGYLGIQPGARIGVSQFSNSNKWISRSPPQIASRFAADSAISIYCCC